MESTRHGLAHVRFSIRAFGPLSDFGFRHSDFAASPPHSAKNSENTSNKTFIKKSPMKSPALLAILLATANALGADIDTMGGTLLHQVDPTLQGAGIHAAQPEAPNGAPGTFEVDPTAVGQPTSLFTW